MAFSIPWDEASPAGASTNASTIDTELQDLKKSVRERMNQLLDPSTAWETDGDDPKLLDVTALAGTPKLARVWDNAAFALPSGVITVIDFVAETFDTAAFHSNSVNPSRLTAPVAGYYRIGTSIAFSSGAASALVELSIRANGTTVFAEASEQHPGGSVVHTAQIHTIVLAAASDFFEVIASQTSGNAWATTNTERGNFFYIEKIDGTT